MSNKLDKAVIEFSKELINKIVSFFICQLMFTFIIMCFFQELSYMLIDLFRATIPFYIAGLAGYSLKAGAENVSKITTSTTAKPAAKVEPKS